MAEENRVTKEPQGKATQVQQVTKEPRQVATKNPKKVEWVRGWLHTIVRREKNREKNKRNWRKVE